MKIKVFILPLLITFFVIACNEEEQVYPNIITEFAEMKVDGQGVADSIRLDNNVRYRISNKIKDLKPKATYRVVCGYIPNGSSATIYTLEAAYYLRDSSRIAQQAPTEVLSAWRSGRFINLHLTPKTQGGTHYWGYSIDSLVGHNAYLSLHHNQNNDPISYSADVYASIPVDSIRGIQKGDTISLSIQTFKDKKTWTIIR